MQQNPYQKFMQRTVTTMTPGQLVVALYDKAISELNKAVFFIEEEPSIPNAHNSIMRTIEIVDALDASLKEKYEISETLANAYAYFRDNLIYANVKKDAERLKTLIPYFTELRDAFAEASKGF